MKHSYQQATITVIDTNNQPVSGAYVEVDNYYPLYEGYTDTNGQFTVDLSSLYNPGLPVTIFASDQYGQSDTYTWDGETTAITLVLPATAPPPIQTPNGVITAIRVHDVARNLWFSWDAGQGWDNAGGGGNNAPVGQSPVVTPGQNNLYIAFYAVNRGILGNIDLTIEGNNNRLAFKTLVNVSTGSGNGLSWQGTMPNSAMTIILMVFP